MRWSRVGLIACAACLLCGCASLAHRSNLATTVVDNYIAAINRRDLLALTAYVAPNVQWYSVVNGERTLEVSGREQLARLLGQYFDKHRHTRWSIDRSMVVDANVAAIERSEWGEREPFEARTSLGIYEIVDGRIRRMTYFLTDR